METITIEKIVKFDNIIDSIEKLQVNEDLKYDIIEDNTHAVGTISLSGSVNTIMGKNEFNEDVDVDIYTPFEKIIDKDLFKITLKDYSYVVNQQNLVVYLILDIDGIISNKEVNNDKQNNEEVLSSSNELSQLNSEIIENTNENDNELFDDNEEDLNVTMIDNNTNETINQTWATDLFKLSDNYSLFMKIHLK